MGITIGSGIFRKPYTLARDVGDPVWILGLWMGFGLVSLCVPDAELQAKAMEVATKIATGPKYATRFTKRVLNQWLLQFGPIFDHSLALAMMGFFSKDLLEDVDSVRGKRPAKFPSNG